MRVRVSPSAPILNPRKPDKVHKPLSGFIFLGFLYPGLLIRIRRPPALLTVFSMVFLQKQYSHPNEYRMNTGKQRTSKQIENAKPKEKPYKPYDRNQSCLIVQFTGGRLLKMDYSFNGKRKTASLGKFPLVSLARGCEEKSVNVVFLR